MRHLLMIGECLGIYRYVFSISISYHNTACTIEQLHLVLTSSISYFTRIESSVHFNTRPAFLLFDEKKSYSS